MIIFNTVFEKKTLEYIRLNTSNYSSTARPGKNLIQVLKYLLQYFILISIKFKMDLSD